jgi:hypothetical protein
MYEIKLINPLRQFGVINWTLTFSDPAEVLPSIRVDKKYTDEENVPSIQADIKAYLENAIYEMTTTEETPGVVVDLTGETVSVDDVGGHYEWQL